MAITLKEMFLAFYVYMYIDLDITVITHCDQNVIDVTFK